MKTYPNVIAKAGWFAKCLTILITVTFWCHPVRADDQVPFKGAGEAAIAVPTPGPGGLEVSIFTLGQATQLGAFTGVNQMILDVSGSLTGTIVFTAANGDQLTGTASGTFGFTPTTITGTYVFTGGTGRFKNATGGANFVVRPGATVPFTIEFEGTLSLAKGP